MTYGAIVRLIQRHSPVTPVTLLKSCKFTLRFLGSGSFRDVYEIVGSGYVVKFPNQSGGESHAENERRTWNKIRKSKRFAEIHKYLPSQMYLNRRSGCIVMPLYEEADDPQYDDEMDEVADIIHRITGNSDNDLASDKWDNWGVDQEGKLVMIDLGCLESFD
jgi:hypothetical protein